MSTMNRLYGGLLMAAFLWLLGFATGLGWHRRGLQQQRVQCAEEKMQLLTHFECKLDALIEVMNDRNPIEPERIDETEGCRNRSRDDLDVR